jgi:hypothetical protein
VLLPVHIHCTDPLLLLRLCTHCRGVLLTLRALRTRLVLLLPLPRTHQASGLAATAFDLTLDPAALM